MSISSKLVSGVEVAMDRCQHYFIKDTEGMLGCVAIAPMEVTGPGAGRICRGIALCAPADVWDRDAARKKAIARIRRAVGTESDGLPIMNEANDSVQRFYANSVSTEILGDSGDSEYVMKSSFDIEPTKRELGIIYHLVTRLGGTPVDPS